MFQAGEGITTQRAGRIPGMSRPYRIKLCRAGVLPYQTVGISGGPTCGHRESVGCHGYWCEASNKSILKQTIRSGKIAQTLRAKAEPEELDESSQAIRNPYSDE